MIFQVEHPFFAEGIEVFLGLGNLVIDFQERVIIVVQAIALRRMSTVRSQDNSIYAHAGDVVLRRISSDFFIADDFFAGDDGVFGCFSNIHILEFAAPDANGAIRRSLLCMDDGYIDLRNRYSHYLFTRFEGVVNVFELVIRNFVQGLADFLADAPFIGQAGALHQGYRQERQPQCSSMPHHVDDVLGIIFHGELASFEPFSEPSGYVGNTGVGGIAVDVCFDTAVADQHIPVAAGSAAQARQISDTLSQDFKHSSIRFTVSRKTTQSNVITTMHIFGDCVF